MPSAAVQLEYRLLGPLEISREGHILPIKAPKQRALLARLLLSRNESVSAERLIDDLWSDHPPAKAPTALQVYVSHVRKLLEPERGPRQEATVLQSQGSSYLLSVPDGQLDINRFERMTSEGQGLLASDPVRASSVLAEALCLWRGPALADFLYEAWAQTEAARLEELRLTCVEGRLEAELACGRHAELVGELEGLVREYRLRERLRGQLMLALYRSGRQADALQAYQDGREALVEELGLDPSAKLQALYRAILNQGAELAAPARVERRRGPVQLPTPTSSFLGRERELSELVGMLVRDSVRLLTMTGPGGVGKTRLARQAAAKAADSFPEGVFWVGLSALRDPALVTETISQTVGAKDGLAEHIGERELLLLLDNLEQVIEAAPELSRLISVCPNLTVVVTSRELLRIQGEIEYSVPPLQQPEAVSLFCERAQTEPSAEIAELCRCLDSLPLAVELAAARTKVLSAAQILERLPQGLDLLRGGRDADPRQQTLRATIAWSYELLSPDEQDLFAHLAIFAGGCTLQAAEEVCDADLDTLQSLIEKSLLRFTNERYWMLETIREYAMEHLAQSEASGVRERHTSHFAALAEDAEPHLRRSDRAWLERIESEQDNLRVVLDRLEEEGDGDRASSLAGAMWRFWYLRSRFREGRLRLERVLGLDRGRSIARGKVLHGAAVMEMNSGDLARAQQLTDEAVELCEALDDVAGTAYSLLLLGNLNAERGNMADAKPLLAESLRLFLETGEQDYALVARFNLAWAHAELNDRVSARSLHEENLAWAREISNEGIEASALAQLAMLALIDGRLQDARTQLRSAIAIARELDDPLEVAYDLCRFASLSSANADHRTSLQLIARADALREEIGASFEAWAVALNGDTLASCQSNLGEEFAQVWDDGRGLTVDEAIELALGTAG